MTSVLRRYSQMDSRTQYFFVLDVSCTGYTFNTRSPISSAPVMSIADFNTAYAPTMQYLVGFMLKDLGRFIHVYDPNSSNNLYQIYRQVMLVGPQRPTNSAGFEGVTSQISYVCTWSADNTSSPLARSG